MTQALFSCDYNFIDVIRASVMEPIRPNLHASNQLILKQIIRLQLRGETTLPYQLGLSQTDYERLLNHLDDDALHRHNQQWQHHNNETLHKRSQLIEALNQPKIAERDALVKLLLASANPAIREAQAMAVIVATACLSPTHLWRSLGLTSRAQLRECLTLNFPALALANRENMRWKRFFYLQLCKQEGDFVCRAPSCELCGSRAECYDTSDE